MTNGNESGEHRTPRKMEIIKAFDLIKIVREEPEPNFLWKGIPEKSMGLITGVGKTGKTTFAENLGISIAVGRTEFFGEKLLGEPKKVLFVNLEESYRVRSRRNYRQIQRLCKNELKLFQENYLSTPQKFLEYVNSDSDWEYLRDYISLSEAEVVIIDSLTHMFKGQIEQSEAARNFTEKLKIYLRSLDKTFIIVHHNIKGNEKPIDQDSIAGSRVILQEFEFALGLANIPTSQGGNYACMLFNKHIENDSTRAILYKMESDGWINEIGEDNKFNLYKNSTKKDWRENSTNSELILDYFQSQTSQDSPVFSSSTLMSEFVKTKKMSKDTMYRSLDKLSEENVIARLGRGEYGIVKPNSNGGSE